MNMSSPVDVVRLMNEVERVLLDDGFASTPRELADARSAVENLIEKVDELLSTHGEYRGYGGAGEAIEERMRAELVHALARVRGEE